MATSPRPVLLFEQYGQFQRGLRRFDDRQPHRAGDQRHTGRDRIVDLYDQLLACAVEAQAHPLPGLHAELLRGAGVQGHERLADAVA